MNDDATSLEWMDEAGLFIHLLMSDGTAWALSYNQLLHYRLDQIDDQHKFGARGTQRITLTFFSIIAVIEGDRLEDIFYAIDQYKASSIKCVDERFRHLNPKEPWVTKIAVELVKENAS